MNSRRTRLAAGVGVLAVIALTAILTTTSALAQTIAPFFGRATLTCATGTGLATTGATSTACSITPGGTYTLTTEHVFASFPVGNPNNVQRAMQLHQRAEADARFGHAAGSHWFYVWAQNVAPATAFGTNTAFFYYAPPQRTSVSITTAAGVCAGTGTCAVSAAAGSAVPATIYAQAGNRAAIVDVDALTYTTASAVATAATFTSTALSGTFRWGHAQDWWLQGTVGFNARADQFAGAGSSTGLGSGWNNTGVTLTLANSTPVQSVSGGGSRVVAAGSNAPFIVTVTDANGDILKVRLLLRRVTGGGWFALSAVSGDNQRDNVNTDCASATVEYQSNTEAYQALPCTTGIFSTYLGQTSGGTNSGYTTSGGGANDTDTTYTFNVIPTTNARGTWNVYVQTIDQHGGNTGTVLVGSLTVS